jgi:rare lipoprotein A
LSLGLAAVGSARAHKVPACEQVGTASWCGPRFHGKKTANGEVFNQNKLTAAHRTLPLGTTVEVTNVTNGKSVKVKITDRGP